MKKVIIEILDYLKYQVENDKCTADELKSIYESVAKNIEVDASIKDIADFYGKTENNVSTVLTRNYAKPKRKVYYNFNWFRKIMPASWSKKNASH